MSEMRPVDQRRNWRGIVGDYDAIIANPSDTTECLYCLTVPQAQLLIMYAETLRWRTRWDKWDGDEQAILDFSEDLIERLIMPCCDEQNPQIKYQVSGDGTYTLQVSYDGGTTWETDNSDPRLTTTALPPIDPGTPDLKCQAAWNGRKGFEDAVQVLATVLDVSLTLITLSVAIASILAIILFAPTQAYKLIPVVIQLANYLVGVSDTDFLAAFTTYHYNALQCALYCNMDENGVVSDLQAVVTTLCNNIDCSGIPGNTFQLLIWGLGTIAINGMCSTDRGANEYDCTDCLCDTPACDFSTWDVWLSTGTLISRSVTSIVVESISGGDGNYYANVSSGDSNTCCCLVPDYGGVSPSANGYIPCGTAINPGNINYSFTVNSNGNTFVCRANVPFTLTMTASECP